MSAPAEAPQLSLFGSALQGWIDEAPDRGDYSKRQSIAVRFSLFHQQNPEVYRLLVAEAREAKAAGFDRYSIKALWEVVRHRSALAVKRDPKREPYKLNNDFTAPMARLIMAREPDLAGFFETRRRRSE